MKCQPRPRTAILKGRPDDDYQFFFKPSFERLNPHMFPVSPKTSFQRVAEFNVLMNNPVGDVDQINWEQLENGRKMILSEVVELEEAIAARDFIKARDALCDIQIFSQGEQHKLGLDGDADMHDVVDGLFTRFIKNDEDKAATIAKHAAKGVTEVYFEGKYPTMAMKSAVLQPDAPVGKMMKSASFSEPVFRDPPVRVVNMQTDPIVGNRLMEHTLAPDPVEFGNVTSLAG